MLLLLLFVAVVDAVVVVVVVVVVDVVVVVAVVGNGAAHAPTRHDLQAPPTCVLMESGTERRHPAQQPATIKRGGQRSPPIAEDNNNPKLFERRR